MEIQTTPLATAVIAAAIEVHRHLGPGLLESVYEHCMAHELTIRGLTYKRQMAVPVDYKGVYLDCGYRIDFLVDGELLLELKTVEMLLPIHKAQLKTYLRLLSVRQGLLLNFNVLFMKDGIKSVLL